MGDPVRKSYMHRRWCGGGTVKFSVRTPIKGVGRKISVHPGGWTLRGMLQFMP